MTLSRDELEQHLMPYVDGELAPAEAAAVEQALAFHPDLASEVQALRDLSGLTRVAFAPRDAHVAAVDFSGLGDRVLARLEADDRVMAPRSVDLGDGSPTLGARFAAWWRGFFAFERPFALAGAAAVAVAVLGTLALRDAGDGGSIAPNNVANKTLSNAPKSERVRRGPESEVALGGRGAVRIESVEVTDGEVFVEGGADESDKPLVLWHVVEGESSEAPAAPTGGGL
jgi:anti-sigma factor RsiW